MVVLAIDPGRVKCGLAVVAPGTPCQVLLQEVVETSRLCDRVRQLLQVQPVDIVLIGNATGTKAVTARLRELIHHTCHLQIVDETGTTARARVRYFRENPPRGWRRLLPVGLQTPPVPCDDYAALILAEDWLSRKDIL